MKKLTFFLFFALSSSLLIAQSIDDIKDQLSKNNWDILKAKGMIDKYLANPKNASNAEGYYYKGFIYNALSKADSLKSPTEDYKWEAFEALKKYQSLDKTNLLMVVNQNALLFDIYNNYYYILAIKAYNDGKYADALSDFKKASEVEDYVRSKDFDYNGFKFPAFDTTLVLNTALAARNSKDTATALVYYKKITDLNLTDPQYLAAYEFPVEYYVKIKDAASAAPAIEKGKKAFPKEDFWTVAEVELAEDAGTKDQVFKKYEELQQQDPGNYTISYNYSVELYNYIFANDDKKIKTDKYKPLLHDALQKAIAIKSTGEDNLLMAKYFYNSSFDNGDSARKIRSTKPDELKRKKIFTDSSIAQLNEGIPYAQAAADYYAAQPKLKPIEKANYKTVLGILYDIYNAKNETAKAAEYDKKMKDVQ